jgi:hypothetical protein
VAIEHTANTLPASHILCAKFCTNGKKRKGISFHIFLGFGGRGGDLPNFKKEEEMYLFLPHFFLGFREKGRVGVGWAFFVLAF